MALGRKIKDLHVRIGADTRPLTRGLKNISSQVQGLGGKLAAVGRAMTIGITAPVLGMGAAAVKSFAGFDSAMTQSLAIMGDVSDALRKDMVGAARQVARETTISSTQAAEAYFFLASAGLDAQQSMAALPQVAKFAQAGMFDMATATDLATDAQSALGKVSKDAGENLRNLTHITDVLVKGNTLANASVAQFSESLTNRAAAAARQVGKEIEEVVAVLAALADQGVKGARAGNEFAIVMRNLQTAALENESAFKKFGVEVFDARGNLANMADIIGGLENALEGMSAKQQKATLATLGFSDRAQATLLTLIGVSDKVRDYEKALGDAAGTTDKIANNQMKSLTAQLTVMRNVITDAATSFGEVLAPVVAKMAERVKDIAIALGEMSDSTRLAIVVAAGLAAAVGPLLATLGALIHLVPLLGTGLAALTGPIGLTVLAIGGLIAAGTAIIVNWDKVKKYLDTQFPGSLKILGTAFETAKGLVEVAVSTIKDVVQGMFDGLLQGLSIFSAAWRGDWAKVWELSLKSVEDFVNDVLNFIPNQLSKLRPVINNIRKAVLGITEGTGGFTLFPDLGEGGLLARNKAALDGLIDRLKTASSTDVDIDVDDSDVVTAGRTVEGLRAKIANLLAPGEIGKRFKETFGNIFGTALLNRSVKSAQSFTKSLEATSDRLRTVGEDASMAGARAEIAMEGISDATLRTNLRLAQLGEIGRRAAFSLASDLSNAIGDLVFDLLTFNRRLSDTELALERLGFGEQLKSLREQFREGTISAERYRLEVDLIRERQEELSASVSRLKVAWQSFGDAMKRIMAGVIADLTAAIAKAAALKALGAALGIATGGFGNLVLGAFGGARAMGGPVMGGKAYLVGEKGPEMFVPRQSGNIVPNTAPNVHLHGNFGISMGELVFQIDEYRRAHS